MRNYNMGKLTTFDELNAAAALTNFSSNSEYFLNLDIFAENAPRYLREFNPPAVVYGPEVRSDFIKEMELIHEHLNSLKMLSALSKLDGINDALERNDIKALSEGIFKFFQAVEITLQNVLSARQEEAHPLTPQTPVVNTAPVYNKPLILAVDDKPEILTTIQGVLSARYKVIAVTSAEAALKAIDVLRPELFLLDIEMPGISGLKLAEKIRSVSAFENTPILFLTSLSTKENVLSAFRNGANDFLVKPINKDTLIAKIETQLKK